MMEASEMLKSLENLATLVGTHRKLMNEIRELPLPLVNAMVDDGLFKLIAPRELGGAELDPVVYTRLLIALSRIDGSVGWNAMIGSGISWLAASLPAAAAESFFGDRRAIVAGHLEPRGQADCADGGYRINGRWSFGSGCRQATSLLAGCVLQEDGRPRLGEGGQPEFIAVLLPADACTILDTWRVTGLRGTGSHDYVIKDQFVPVAHTFNLTTLLSGAPRNPTYAAPLFAMPLTPLYASMTAAIPLGIARAALDECIELAKSKRSFGSPQALSESPATHREIGRAQMLVHTAEVALLHDLEDIWSTVKTGATPTLEQHARMKMSSVNAAVNSGASVDLLYSLAGTSAIFESHRIESCFRDVHVAMQHVQVATKALEIVGRIAFGMNPGGII